MLESQQLLVEETSRRAMAVLRFLASWSIAVAKRLLFWQIPPRSASLPTILPRRSDLLGNLHVFTAYRDATNLLFLEDWRNRHEVFGVSGPGEDARRLIEENFISYPSTRREVDHVFWGSHSLESFLSAQIVGRVILFGSAHYRLEFSSTDGSFRATSIRSLEQRDLRKVRLGSRRGQYRHVLRPSDEFNEMRKPVVVYIPADEIATFEHPEGRKRASRIIGACHHLVKRDNELQANMDAWMSAVANPEDKRTWAERARRFRMKDITVGPRQVGWRIATLYGGLRPIELLQVPATDFYRAFAGVSYKLWLSELRESLCQQFNEQVVARVLKKNGLSPDSASIETLHFRTSEEWKAIRARLVAGELSDEEVQAILYPELRKTDAESATQEGGGQDREASAEDSAGPSSRIE